MRVLTRLLMLASFAMFLAALIRLDLGLISHFQAGVRVSAWGLAFLITAVVSDAIEL
nr:MAG TPA: Protein of unknown function (DUF2633) [Caudoviricetes sp.]